MRTSVLLIAALLVAGLALPATAQSWKHQIAVNGGAQFPAGAEQVLGVEGVRADQALAEALYLARIVARPGDLADSREAGFGLDADEQVRTSYLGLLLAEED